MPRDYGSGSREDRQDGFRYAQRDKPPEIEYIDSEEELEPKDVGRVEKNALTIYAQRYDFDLETLRKLGMEPGRVGTDEVVFTYNVPGTTEPGWRKIRHINVKRDRLVTIRKTGKTIRQARFVWDEDYGKPENFLPLWPWPEEHETMLFFEGETDCTCARQVDFDNAYTYGACTNIPGEREREVLLEYGCKRAYVFFDFDSASRDRVIDFCDALRESGINAFPANLRSALAPWLKFGAKDVRDIYAQVTREEFRKILDGLIQACIDDENAPDTHDALVFDAVVPGWFWQDVVVKCGMNLAVAPGKTGKSAWWYELMDAARDGTNFLGRGVLKAKVLLLSEMDKGYAREYQERYMRSGASHVHAIFHDPEKPMTWLETTTRAKRMIEKHGIELLIVDTANQFMGFQGEEINQSSAIRAKLDPLRVLCKQGVTILVAHHTPHGRDTPLGSVDWGNVVDNKITITRDKEDVTTIDVVGRSGACVIKAVYESDADGYLRHVLEDEASKNGKSKSGRSDKDIILACIPSLPSYTTHRSLVETLPEINADTIRKNLQRWADSGTIAVIPRSNPKQFYKPEAAEIEEVELNGSAHAASTESPTTPA